MRSAVIVIVHGRRAHLDAQLCALALSDERPDDIVIVAIDDDELVTNPPRQEGIPAPRIVQLDADPLGLPLAAARNLGARTALADAADLLLFLDVDCLPDPRLVTAYREAAEDPATHGTVLCGPVTYLQPAPPDGYDLHRLPALRAPHPARPAPPPGSVEVAENHELFWSLSFAVTASVWARLGGFHEEYRGYGGEDTDFGVVARERGVPLAWVGDAHAYHQFHPSADPPLHHLDDILRNAEIYHRRWGSWPMLGWIDRFAELGLVCWDESGGRFVRTSV